MTLLIIGVLLGLVAIVLVLAPVLRGSARAGTSQGQSRSDGALAIFADQVAEVDRDVARGVISAEEAEGARVEIKRRMLAVSKAEESALRTGGTGVLFALALCVPLLGAVIYATLGRPDVPSQPFASRAVERAEDARISDLTEELRLKLLAEPGGGEIEGWVLLGQTYMRQGRYGQAALAFAQISERPGIDASVLTQYGEALIAAEDGIVTNRAVIILERAIRMDPSNPAATYYLAQWLEQEGREDQARGLLINRLERAENYQPWMDIFVEQTNRISAKIDADPVNVDDFVDRPRGPSQADMAAAAELSPEERREFIKSMVAGLAERMEEDPSNLDGWLRLGGAYMVLDQRADARRAYQAAEGLLEDLAADDPRRAAVAEGLAKAQ